MAAEAKRKELMEKVREDVGQMKTRWQDMLIREQEAFFYDLRQRAAKQLIRNRTQRRCPIWRMPISKIASLMNLSGALAGPR